MKPIEKAKLKAPVIAHEIRMVSSVPMNLQLKVFKRLLFTFSLTLTDGSFIFDLGFITIYKL